MDHNEELEIKKEFQLERIILFSDAVFAIIVTIMVIELRLPEHIREAGVEEFKHALHALWVQFAGYMLSFFFVAMFWMRHVKLLGFLKDYTPRFLMLNLLFLFCISLFPFAVTMLTGFTKVNSLQAAVGFNLYVFIILSSMFSYTLLAGYMVHNKEQLCCQTDKMDRQLKWKAQRTNYYLIPLTMALIIMLNLLHVRFEFIGTIMGVYGITISRIKKHFYPNTNADDEKPVMRRMFGKW